MPTPARGCVGAIVAGGLARRFGGRPKGLELVGDRRILDRVADALRPSTTALLLVSGDASADAWLPDARRVDDPRPGLGSLGGLYAALVHAAGAPVLAIAWDMPFVPPALAAALREVGDAHADVDAVLPEGAVGTEPLCAWYHPRCTAVARALLDRGERRARALGEAVRTAALPLNVVARHGDPSVIFLSVNTPADLERARALVEGGAAGRPLAGDAPPGILRTSPSTEPDA